MKWLIIGGNNVQNLWGKTGTEVKTFPAVRKNGTRCILRQLAEYPTQDGKTLVFLPEHLMPLPPEQKEQVQAEKQLVNSD